MAAHCSVCGERKKLFGRTFFQCRDCGRVWCDRHIPHKGFFSGKCVCGAKIRASDKI